MSSAKTSHPFESSHQHKGEELSSRGEGDGRMVDWRSRPISSTQHLGGWSGALCTLVSAGCGYFAFSGIYLNLVLYLIRVWKESNTGAANDLTNLLGTLFFTSVIGAFLGDAYWGRLWTVVVFQIIFAVGCVLVSVAVTLQENSHAQPLPGGLKAFLFVALYITALGSGSYEPAIASLGGDQFDTPRQKATYFNWMFVFCNIGEVPALTILTYVENRGAWALGFWISSAVVVLSIPIFVAGAPYCRQYRAGGNPILRLVQVLVCAARKMKVKAEADPKKLYEVPGDYSIIQGCLKIQHRERFRWLDKAATITFNDARNIDSISPWRLCTITQVEEVKGWISIIPVLLVGVLGNVVIAQGTTLFVEQGAIMQGEVGSEGFRIPPGSMQIISVLVATILAPMYDYGVVPLMKRWTKHPKGITSLQRMGCGVAAIVLAMVVAALVEKKRLEAFQNGHTLSILWLVPQYVIGGVSAVLLAVGQMDFFYTEISEGVRSLGICLTLVCRGLGNFGSTLLLSIVTSISSHHGKYLGWIPHKDLNLGHLDYFYWSLASITFITLVLYIIYAHHYTYLEQMDLCNHELDNQSRSFPLEINH